MPIVPKLNLSAAVKVHNDTLNITNENDNLQSDTSQRTEPELGNKSPTKSTSSSLLDDQFLEDDGSDIGFKEPQCLINTDFDFKDDLNQPNEQYLRYNETQPNVIYNDSSNISSPQGVLDIDAASESSLQSFTSFTAEPLITSFESAGGVQSSSQLVTVANRKRRRTVNKLDQDPEKIPLRDLLFYNPPETIFQKENKTQENESETITKRLRRTSRSNSVTSESQQQQKPDEVIETKKDDDNSNIDETSGSNSEPLLTIDESGNVVLKNPDAINETKEKKHDVKMKSSTTYNSFRRRERSKNIWNNEETSIFYTALEIVGTDFSLMEAVFFKDRGRDRKQLKQKFKREEKINRAYIDKILFKSLTNKIKAVAKWVILFFSCF